MNLVRIYELLVAVGSTPNLDAFASPNESLRGGLEPGASIPVGRDPLLCGRVRA